MKGNLEFKILEIKSKDDFEILKPLWKSMDRIGGVTAFQSYEWNLLLYRQWNNNVYNRIFSKMCFVYNNQIIIPLIIQRVSLCFKFLGRKKGIYFLGYDSYSDYLDFIYNQESEKEEKDILLNEAIEYCLKKFELPFYFHKIRQDSYTCKFLRNMQIDDCKENVSISVNLSYLNGTDEYYKLLSKSTRQNLRTALNRMHKASIDYRIEVKEGILDKALIDELLAIHIKRVLEINSKSHSFLNSVANILRKKRIKKVELNNNIITEAMRILDNSVTIISYCDDEIVGYLYGLREVNKIRILQNCVKDEYKFYSPMFRGAFDYICMCIESGIDEVDFTRGKEEYKYKLGGEELMLYSFTLNENYIKKLQ